MITFLVTILLWISARVSGFLHPSVRPMRIFPASIPRQHHSLCMNTLDLERVGDEITIGPPEGNVKRIVMKFGGSSLATPERIMYVAKLIAKHVEQGYRPIIICSAMGKTTNTLLAAGDFALSEQVYVDSLRTLHLSAAKTLNLSNSTLNSLSDLLSDLEKMLEGIKYIGELTPRTKDALVSFGERMSVRIVAGTLNRIGIPAQAFDAWSIGMRTSSEFGNSEVLEESYSNIKSALGKHDSVIVPVITGFIGHDSKGRITTLGRGGSDLTATVVGSAIPADEVQVWKDVDGIMTADPKLVKTAMPVTAVTYEEAAELAFFGAEVLHPISMQPAIRSSIPVRVKNSYNPSAVGTVITATRDKSQSLVTAITSKANVVLIDIVSTRMLGQYGFLAKVFEAFEQCKLSVDVVASSDVSVSLTLDKKQQDKDQISTLLSKLSPFAEVDVLKDRCIVSIICNTDRASEVIALAFKIVNKLGVKVEMLSQGASKVNIGMVIPMKDKEILIRSLHACYFEGKSVDDL